MERIARTKDATASKRTAKPVDWMDKTRLLWTLYIPPIGAGALTIASIVMANRINTQRVAAMATAFALSQRAHSEYKDKVKEHFGLTKESKVRAEVAKEKFDRHPPNKAQIIITGGGDVLCFDPMSERYFYSDMHTILDAQNKVNAKRLKNDEASLTDFYELIGISATKLSDHVGWTAMGDEFEIDPTPVLADDGRPCISLDFDAAPLRNYSHMQ
jgi:hypothetical protein